MELEVIKWLSFYNRNFRVNCFFFAVGMANKAITTSS